MADRLEALALRPQTLLVRGGLERSNWRETSEALCLTSGFVYESAEQAESAFDGRQTHWIYSRFGNPTVAQLERKLCGLEGAQACRATSSGMAAVHAALLAQLKTGDRVVASRALFGSCHWIVTQLLPRYGIRYELVAGADLDAWRSALASPAALVLLETPSNPMLEVIDLREVCTMAHAAGALVVVDNVFATPLLQRPLDYGADVVVYSCTKHFDGQGRVLGGAVLGTEAWVEETLQPFLRNTGPALSPFNAWVINKGLETMQLRLAAACSSALRVAEQLAGAEEVSCVRYPFLASHPQVTLAKKQMSAGGSLVTFELRGGKAAAFAFCNALKLIDVSNNLGDTRSLITHPASTTHFRIGSEERAKLGITDGFLRLSLGLEDAADLSDDLARGLAAAAEAGGR